jgi:hypothetical protein
MSHTLGDVPGLQFSRSISFAGEAHDASAASGATVPIVIAPAAASTATGSLQRLVAEAARTSFDLQKSISVTRATDEEAHLARGLVKERLRSPF